MKPRANTVFDRIYVSPGVLATAISSGMVTYRSTSSGDWPGYCAMISMIGGAGSGYASMFIVENAATPTAMETTYVISTSGRRDRQNAIRLRSITAPVLAWVIAAIDSASRSHHGRQRAPPP